MTFTEFSSDNSTGCDDEKLTIYDGEDVKLGEYCGKSNLPSVSAFAPVTSAQNTVTVVFDSKASLSWEIEWSAVKKSSGKKPSVF